MADYAVMPKADYQDACNAVREKTGGTAVIKSGDLGDQIRAISAGGLDPENLTIVQVELETKATDKYTLKFSLPSGYTLQQLVGVGFHRIEGTPADNNYVNRVDNCTRIARLIKYIAGVEAERPTYYIYGNQSKDDSGLMGTLVLASSSVSGNNVTLYMTFQNSSGAARYLDTVVTYLVTLCYVVERS